MSLKKACLFIIIDDCDEDYNLYSFYLNYFNKKLKDLNIFLSKTYLITRLDSIDLDKQFKNLINIIQNENENENENEKSSSFINYLLLTTTNVKNDYLMLKLVNDNLTNLDLIKDDYLNHNSTLSNTEPLLSYKKSIFIIKNQTLFNTISILIKQLNNLNSNINETFLNADYFVYNFEQISFKKTQENTTKLLLNDDLKFLLNKINLNNFYTKLGKSIQTIEKCLQKSSNKQTCISFNGGKDCCVVLYLFYAIATRIGYKFPLNLLIINIMHSFEEMDLFIDKLLKSFYKNSLQLILFDDTSKTLKECLCELKVLKPDIEYILMGTRRSDSSYFNQMPEFAPTDSDWPQYIRVNPILDWTYGEIWYFIRLLNLPYCSLYDHGYTSLDNTKNTVPNKALLKQDGSYLPAYFLNDDSLERESRKKYAKI